MLIGRMKSIHRFFANGLIYNRYFNVIKAHTFEIAFVLKPISVTLELNEQEHASIDGVVNADTWQRKRHIQKLPTNQKLNRKIAQQTN